MSSMLPLWIRGKVDDQRGNILYLRGSVVDRKGSGFASYKDKKS